MTARQILFSRISRTLCPVLLAMLLCPALALAGGERVTNAVAPMLDRLINSKWNILVVSVENPNPTPLESTVIIHFKQGKNSYMRPVWLPPKSRGKFFLPVYCDIQLNKLKKSNALKSRDRTITFPDGTKQKQISSNGSVDYTVALLKKGSSDEYGRYNGKLMIANPQDIAMLLVEEYFPEPEVQPKRIGTDGLPRILGDGGEFTTTKTNYDGQSMVGPYCLPKLDHSYSFMARTSSSDLVPFCAGYGSLNSIWIGALNDNVSPAVENALEQWLKAGGQINLCPTPAGKDYLQKPFWSATSPAVVTGFSSENAQPMQPLAKQYGGKIFTGKPAPMTYALLVSNNNNPSSSLFAQTASGAGKVCTLAFGEQQASYWNRAAEFYQPLIEGPTPLLAGLKSNFLKSGWKEIRNITGWAIPGKMTIMAIMLSYLILGSAVLFFMRKKGNTEYGWLGLMALGIVFFGIYVGISILSRSSSGSSSAQTGVNLVADNYSKATNYSFFGFTPSGEFKGNLSTLSGNSLLFPAELGQTDAITQSNPAILWDEKSSLPSLSLSTGSFWATGVQSQIDMGQGLHAEYSFTPTGISGSVINNTPHDLYNCFIRFNRCCYYVGNLQQGQQRDFSAADRLWQWELDKKFSTDSDTRKQILLKSLFPADLRYEYNTAPVFCGFFTQQPVGFNMNGSKASGKTEQLVASSPVVDKLPASFTIPAGVCGIKLSTSMLAAQFYNNKPDTDLSTAQNPQTNILAARRMNLSKKNAPQNDTPMDWPHFKQGSGTNQLDLSFELPKYLGKLQITGAKLIIKGKLKDMRMRISTRSASGGNSSKGLKTLQSGDIDTTITLDKKLLAGNSLPVFKIAITSQKASMGSMWKIDTFDIEIQAKREQ